MDLTPYQQEMVNAAHTIGACVQFALVLFGALLTVLCVKALW